LAQISPIEEEAEKLAMEIERTESGRIITYNDLGSVSESHPMSRLETASSSSASENGILTAGGYDEDADVQTNPSNDDYFGAVDPRGIIDSM
jgi:hypothetical protein